jgi:hypothetical protein
VLDVVHAQGRGESSREREDGVGGEDSHARRREEDGMAGREGHGGSDGHSMQMTSRVGSLPGRSAYDRTTGTVALVEPLSCFLRELKESRHVPWA